MRRSARLLLVLPLAACAGGAPVSTSFDRSAGHVEVRLLGDGFVTTAGRRIPLERFVLELRQRVRAMDPADVRERFVVSVRLPRGAGANALALRRQRDLLLDHLEIMGVRQVEYL